LFWPWPFIRLQLARTLGQVAGCERHFTGGAARALQPSVDFVTAVRGPALPLAGQPTVFAFIRVHSRPHRSFAAQTPVRPHTLAYDHSYRWQTRPASHPAKTTGVDGSIAARTPYPQPSPSNSATSLCPPPPRPSPPPPRSGTSSTGSPCSKPRGSKQSLVPQ